MRAITDLETWLLDEASDTYFWVFPKSEKSNWKETDEVYEFYKIEDCIFVNDTDTNPIISFTKYSIEKDNADKLKLTESDLVSFYRLADIDLIDITKKVNKLNFDDE